MGSRHKIFSLHAMNRTPTSSPPSHPHPSYILPSGAGQRWDQPRGFLHQTPTSGSPQQLPASIKNECHVLREGNTDRPLIARRGAGISFPGQQWCHKPVCEVGSE